MEGDEKVTAPRRPFARRYGIALMAALGAIAVRVALMPLLGSKPPYITFYLGIVVGAAFGGLGPGLLVMFIGLTFGFVVLPPGSVVIEQEVARGILFILSGFGICLIAESMHRQRRKVEEQAQDLQRTHDELREAYDQVEQMVQDRTVDLQKKESLLRTMLETLPVGVAVVGADGTMSYFNSAFNEICTGTASASSGDDFVQRCTLLEQDSSTQIKIVDYPSQITMETGMSLHGKIFDIETSKGRTTISSSSAPLRSPSGDITGVVVVVEDITEQQRLQKQLLHSQKLESVGALAGGVAHDFNNVLTAMCGFAELAYSEIRDEELRGHLLQVLQAGERGRDLSQKLLVFSRQQVIETRAIDLSTTVENLLKFVSGLLGDNIHVDIQLCDSPLIVRANPTQIDQVLMNLILNARDAMPFGGHVVISTGKAPVDAVTAATFDLHETGGYAFVKVSDSGTGIAADVLMRLFDPFFTTKVGKGSGLGLAIVHGIIRQHKGGISVETEVGKGSTFTIFLPIVEEAVAGEDAVTNLLLMGSETLLVVEDDEGVRKYFDQVLTKAGYRVVTAADGGQALELLARYDIDAVVSDIMMPGMSGMQMFSQMKKKKPHLKAVFASGYSDEIMSEAPIDAGDFVFLQKPVGRATLLKAIREVLS